MMCAGSTQNTLVGSLLPLSGLETLGRGPPGSTSTVGSPLPLSLLETPLYTGGLCTGWGHPCDPGAAPAAGAGGSGRSRRGRRWRSKALPRHTAPTCGPPGRPRGCTRDAMGPRVAERVVEPPVPVVLGAPVAQARVLDDPRRDALRRALRVQIGDDLRPPDVRARRADAWRRRDDRPAEEDARRTGTPASCPRRADPPCHSALSPSVSP